MLRTYVPRSLLVAAALIAALAAPAPAQGIDAERSPDAAGVSLNGLLEPSGRPRPEAPANAALIRQAGIRIGRTDAFWEWAEPNAPQDGRHAYDWTSLDGIAELMARDGIRWLPVLAYSALWATTVEGYDKAPPQSDADYVAYVEAFARRYGRGGSFWAERPGLPALPVTSYQVWNEPNLPGFWAPEPDPRRYARMYLAARAAIRRADPGAAALAAGLSPYSEPFVDALYDAEPRLRGRVDAVAYHPYERDPEHVLRLVRRMRATLDARGETRVPLWITEVGWPTQGTGGIIARAVPDRTRAADLALVTDALLGSNCDVATLSAHTWVSFEEDPRRDEHWLGIARLDGNLSETAAAYAEAIARNARAAAAPPARALRLCRGRARGTSFGEPLPLGIDVRRTGGRCYEATVTYRGRPPNGVEVVFDTGRAAPATDTDENGTARRCLPRAGRRRSLKISAHVLDVAASRTVARRVP